MQFVGFWDLHKSGVQLLWQGSNPSASFLAVIIGLHALHVLGGVVVLLIIFFRAYRVKTKSYNVIPIEVSAIYWHFVDVLWIYLFIFLQLMH
jgi:cytochrome c oxidase subunit 3